MSVLRRSNNFYDYSITPVLEQNVKSWLEYGLIELGAYTVVKLNNNASNYSTLKRVYDSSYGGSGRVYEGFGPSWIWESGVSTPNGYDQIFQPSGVYINNIFYSSSTSGAYAHKVDYKNGRIIFNSSIPSSSVVKCEYCFRDIEIYLASDTRWRRAVSRYKENYQNIQTFNPSGLASVMKENRLWDNCVILEANDRMKAVGLQLGGGQIVDYNITYNIFSNSPFISKTLTDTISDQQEKVLTIYNINTAPHVYNYDGTLNSGVMTYKELSNRNSPYFLTFARIDSARSIAKQKDMDNFYHSQVFHLLKVDRYFLY